MSLFYIEYGCSNCHEHLVVEAKFIGMALEYADQSAKDSWYSYDNGDYSEVYPDASEDELAELEENDMANDIFFCAEDFVESNETHLDALIEQNYVPYEI